MPVEPGKTQYSNGNSAPVQNIHILDTPPRTPRVWANVKYLEITNPNRIA